MTRIALDAIAERINALGQQAKQLVMRMDARTRADEWYAHAGKDYNISRGYNGRERHFYILLDGRMFGDRNFTSIEEAKRYIDQKVRGDGPTDHEAQARKHEAAEQEHRKLGRGRSGSIHTTAEKDNRMAASFHRKAINDPKGWAVEANKASEAAERTSRRAYTEEPNGPPQSTPQVKW